MRRIIEGGFASGNPRAVLLAGPDAIVSGEPDGIAVAKFGWADKSTGRATNTRTAPTQELGFVGPLSQPFAPWQARNIYSSLGFNPVIRPGLPITMYRRGDFYCRFPAGAQLGARVYANLSDGTPISGYADDAEETPWTVARSAGPGQLAVISTWSTFPS